MLWIILVQYFLCGKGFVAWSTGGLCRVGVKPWLGLRVCPLLLMLVSLWLNHKFCIIAVICANDLPTVAPWLVDCKLQVRIWKKVSWDQDIGIISFSNHNPTLVQHTYYVAYVLWKGIPLEKEESFSASMLSLQSVTGMLDTNASLLTHYWNRVVLCKGQLCLVSEMFQFLLCIFGVPLRNQAEKENSRVAVNIHHFSCCSRSGVGMLLSYRMTKILACWFDVVDLKVSLVQSHRGST